MVVVGDATDASVLAVERHTSTGRAATGRFTALRRLADRSAPLDTGAATCGTSRQEDAA
jgi:hypothetical protein